MKVVLKIGGSVIMPDKVDVNYVKKLAEWLIEWKKKHELVVVVGGGKLSREMDAIGRKLTSDEDFLDLFGIYAARLNAVLLVAALGNHACPVIPRSEVEILELKEKFPGKIIICGGFRPRQRTDSVSLEIAKVVGADIVIKGTNVNYVYDKDPEKFKDAKPIKSLSFEELKKYAEKEYKANKPTIMDKRAAEIAIDLKIKIAVLNGKDIGNIENVLEGKEFKGTKIGF